MAIEDSPPPRRARLRSRTPPRRAYRSPPPSRSPPPRRRRRPSYSTSSYSSYSSSSRSPPRRRRRRSPSLSSSSSYSSRSRSPSPPRRRPHTREAYVERRRDEGGRDEVGRDLRTVFVWQLGPSANEEEIGRYFERAGRVRDVRMVRERGGGRHKGAAYVEFFAKEAVQRALRMEGSLLGGGRIRVKESVQEVQVGWTRRRPVVQVREGPKLVSIEELKRLLNPRGLPVGGEGYKRLFVGGVAFELEQGDLRAIFEPFGRVVEVNLQKEGGKSKGYAFVEFERHEEAERALQIDGLEVAGRKLKVGVASGKEEGWTEGRRVMLMQELSRGEWMGKDDGRGMKVVNGGVCVMLGNMFDKMKEEEGFERELAEDVRDECVKSYGAVRHLFVDVDSNGLVFLKFESKEGAERAVRGVSGRWFGGKKATANFVDETEYKKRFPSS